MNEYHKIQTIYKRDQATNHKTLLHGDYSMPEFAYLRDNEWEFTEKVDGTNIRVRISSGLGFHFGGKTDNAQIPPFLVKRLSDIFTPLLGKLIEMFTPGEACLYGEGYGAKIQKGGGNYMAGQDFVLFDVKVGNWWLQRSDVKDVAEKLGLRVVPVIGSGTLLDMVAMARSGIKSQWGDFKAEGIVARPTVELVARNGQRIITKIKTKDFQV